MVNRAADAEAPDDTSHVKALEDAGARTSRERPNRREGAGRGRRLGRRRTHDLEATTSSSRRVPARRCHQSRASPQRTRGRPAGHAHARIATQPLVLEGGPTGVELSQVFARFGVPTTIVQSGPRLVPTDTARNAEAVTEAIRRDGVTIRTAVRAQRARPGPGLMGRTSSSSTTARPPRATSPAGGRSRPRPRGPRSRAVRARSVTTGWRPARWPAARCGRAVDGRRCGRPGTAHPPGSHQGSSRSGGARRRNRTRLPRPSPATTRTPKQLRSAVARPGARGRLRCVRARRRLREDYQGTRWRPNSGMSRSSSTGARASWSRVAGRARRVGRDPRVRPGDQGPGPVDTLAETIHASRRRPHLQRPVRRRASRARAPGELVKSG